MMKENFGRPALMNLTSQQTRHSCNLETSSFEDLKEREREAEEGTTIM
jgi:hypothetical protein